MSRETFLFSRRPDAGIETLFHYDHATDEMIFETIQHADPILEANKATRNLTDRKTPWKGDYHHVAEIPTVLFAQMQKTGAIHDQTYMKRWLNDHDNKPFRVREGRV